MEKPNKSTSSKLAGFLEKPPVRVASALLGLVLAYVFISWAIDSGSLLDYAIAILLTIFGLREITAVIRSRKQ
jgi:hypothetical protein